MSNSDSVDRTEIEANVPEKEEVKNSLDLDKVKNFVSKNWLPLALFFFLFAGSLFGGDSDIKKFFGGKAQPQAMVFVDIDMIVDRHIEKVSKKFDMTEEDVADYSEAFSSQLESSLDYFRERDNVIILVKPAVVRGGVDITKDVYKHILSEIGNE